MCCEWAVPREWPDNVEGLQESLSKTHFVNQVGDYWSPAYPVLFANGCFHFIAQTYCHDSVTTRYRTFLIRYDKATERTVAETIHEDVLDEDVAVGVLPWAVLRDSRIVIKHQVLALHDGEWLPVADLSAAIGTSYLVADPLGGLIAASAQTLALSPTQLTLRYFRPCLTHAFSSTNTICASSSHGPASVDFRCCVFADAAATARIYFVVMFDAEHRNSRCERCEVHKATMGDSSEQVFPTTCTPACFVHNLCLVGEQLVIVAEDMDENSSSVWILDCDGRPLHRFCLEEISAAALDRGINYVTNFNHIGPTVSVDGHMFVFDPLLGMVELRLPGVADTTSQSCVASGDAQTVGVRLRDAVVHAVVDKLRRLDYFDAALGFREVAGQSLDDALHVDTTAACFQALLDCMDVGPGGDTRLASLALAVDLCELCARLCWPHGHLLAQREVWRLCHASHLAAEELALGGLPGIADTLLGVYLGEAVGQGLALTQGEIIGAQVLGTGMGRWTSWRLACMRSCGSMCSVTASPCCASWNLWRKKATGNELTERSSN